MSPNGTSTTGVSPAVVSPNGPSTSGLALTGIDPHGVSASGAQITSDARGEPLAGAGLVGSRWVGHVSDGSTLALRLDAAAANGDRWAYKVSAYSAGAWRPLCVDETGAPAFAESVTGTWNPQQGVMGGGAYNPLAGDFTLACRDSSIAKCLDFGYAPWRGRARELAACVRALRADFCGDGTPYTVSGTLINLYDDAGIQGDTAAWTVEAAWTPDGAACITNLKNTRFSQVAHQVPSCWGHTLTAQASCGSGFAGDVRIITELQSP
ncbi:MAG TPA: ADYC domain-containing protein [Kofleriaceae bacterium]|nr:ADYC domain-containing protein [Kofleriaceae bacterium]